MTRHNGVVALYDAGGAKSLILVGQIARVSSVKAAAIYSVVSCPTPSSWWPWWDVLDEHVLGADHLSAAN